MRANEFLFEGNSHPVIVVDVQPEYVKYGGYETQDKCVDIIKFVNKQTGPVLMFVNADETGTSGDNVEEDIIPYWEETICPEDDRYTYDEETGDSGYNDNCPTINWRRFSIVDKGYGYLRAWMDKGIDPAAIIRVIRAMYQHKITDSRDFHDPELLPTLVGREWEEGLRDDNISVKWTSVSQLKRFSGAYLVGGGRNECLREVEILMNAFNIKYKRIDSLVYGD